MNVDTDNSGIPRFDAYEDHPMHRKAKLQKLRGTKLKRDFTEEWFQKHYESNVVTCPECGVTFDANITIKKDGDHETNS